MNQRRCVGLDRGALHTLLRSSHALCPPGALCSLWPDQHQGVLSLVGCVSRKPSCLESILAAQHEVRDLFKHQRLTLMLPSVSSFLQQEKAAKGQTISWDGPDMGRGGAVSWDGSDMGRGETRARFSVSPRPEGPVGPLH